MNVNKKVSYKSFDLYKGKDFSNGFISYIKKWMLANDVQEVKLDGDSVSTVEHMSKMDKNIHLKMWLEGELSTKRFNELLETEFCNVEYDLKTFVEMIQNA